MVVRDPLLFRILADRLVRVACHVETTTRRFDMRTHVRVARSTVKVVNTLHSGSRDLQISAALHLSCLEVESEDSIAQTSEVQYMIA